MFKVDTGMTTAETALLKAKKLSEVADFLENDITYDENVYVPFRTIYVAYRCFCRRKNVFALSKIDLWGILYDLGHISTKIDGKSAWRGLVPKYVSVIASRKGERINEDENE